MTPRSWLFVPGDSPDKMAKALGAGAEALILDLEDSVAASRKAEARRSVLELMRTRPAGPEIWLRINPADSSEHVSDLGVALEPGFAGVVLPKSDSGRSLLALDEWLNARGAPPSLSVMPIATETPGALFKLGTYGGVTPRLRALTWGGGGSVGRGRGGHGAGA